MPAVASLGTNPTFVEDGDLVLEVHVLDWTGDLYDHRVRTTFIARLRDEQKFDSVDALVAQIRRDIDAARTALAAAAGSISRESTVRLPDP
jgi:riboflavin kinase/FMN adenylyltransferase